MKLKFGIAAVMFVAATSAAALAHGDATGIVKERMDLMKSVASQMKSISAMLKGELPFEDEAIVSAAQTIARHAEEIPDKFPDGSIEGPSEALPVIWEDWDGFVELSAEMKNGAEALAVTAMNAPDPSVIGAHFSTLGKTCLACHQDYREAN